MHVVVFGERGVGKTSLANVIGSVLHAARIDALVVRENCFSSDSFGALWRRAFEQVRFEVSQPGFGLTPAVATRLATLAEHAPEDLSPSLVVALLRQLQAPLVFVFDEFDQIAGTANARAFAETIKALSDFAVPVTAIVVGVGDTVGSLIDMHKSVERAVVQVRMPRMTRDELGTIVNRGISGLGLSIDPRAELRLIGLSQGLPHYTHLLALNSVRATLARGDRVVGEKDLLTGIARASEKAQQSLVDAYLAAVSTPRRDTLFRAVLLACALADSDELGYFSVAAVRAPLGVILDRPIDIPAFARHLNQFAHASRGAVLEKAGTNRKFRYRFANPLLQPFVMMRGLADQDLAPDRLDKLLSQQRHAGKPA